MVEQLGQAMDELNSVIAMSEEEARKLLERFATQGQAVCPRCEGAKLYTLASDRRRCAACRYSFGPFAGRWLARARIPARTWVLALKAFELGLPAVSIGELTGLSRPTLYRVLHTIRLSLAASDSRWEPVSRGGAEGAVFGLRREGSGVRLDRLAQPVAAAGLPRELHRDGVVYTSPHGRYASLLADGRVALGRKGPETQTREPFLKFLKVQTARHYGISRKVFPLYLMEWELRFNRRGKPWFEELARAVTRLERSGRGERRVDPAFDVA